MYLNLSYGKRITYVLEDQRGSKFFKLQTIILSALISFATLFKTTYCVTERFIMFLNSRNAGTTNIIKTKQTNFEKNSSCIRAFIFMFEHFLNLLL